jgi:cytochrome P450
LNRRFYSLLDIPTFIPTPRNIRFKKALADLEDQALALIMAGRKGSGDGNDLLSMLFQAKDEEGRSMDDLELRDEVMALFGAGQESTASVLSTLFYLLDQHPDVETALREELEKNLSGRIPSYEDISLLPYTRAIIEETMRLYPPAWSFVRTVLKDDLLGKYRVKAKSLVILCPYTMHRNPRYWPNPELFDPNRFLPENVESRPRYAYFPFGGGPRICIASNFAMMEMVLVVSVIAQRFRLRLVEGHSVEFLPQITLKARNGILMQPISPAGVNSMMAS